MKNIRIIVFLYFGFVIHLYSQNAGLHFQINQTYWENNDAIQNGRLFIVFSKEKPTTLFHGIQYPDSNMDPVLGIDITDWNVNTTLYVKGTEMYSFPIKNIKEVPPGNWYIYAAFKTTNSTLTLGEEQIYSQPVAVTIDTDKKKQQSVQLTLSKTENTFSQPQNKKHYKYERITSRLLTDFWNTPMFVNFQVILPGSYYTDPVKKYPLLVMIGGFGQRYFDQIISRNELLDSGTPQMIIVLMDSKAPFGDSYQMNSANNGPYGDALITEVIPFIESKYRCVGKSTSRFLTGTSTGGWVSLALQIFYPDFFNGVWSTCSDPVDFRQFELINIYKDENAFINRHGLERPGMRDINGEPRYTVRTEVWSENISGLKNSYALSGGQWGSWNAVFSPRDSITNLPKMIFDPETGVINKEVADAWKKYDLQFYLSENWNDIGHKLQGKLHIWMGTMDSYYLNNAMSLFDNFLKTTANPASDAEVHFICGEGHSCDTNIPLNIMMQQMVERYEKSN